MFQPVRLFQEHFSDIAQAAGISRPLIYVYFNNKKDLFITLNDELQKKYVAKSEKILGCNQSKVQKLNGIINVWIVDPYRMIRNAPYANTWLDELVNISEQSEINFRKLFMKSIAPLVGDDLAEIFVLAIRGLIDDRPPVNKLKNRIRLLIKTIN